MLRYAFNSDIKIKDTLAYDVVIVGAGLAGLYTALNLDPKLSCAILTKEGVEVSNSYLAQGGIAAAIAADDTPVFHMEDTLEAGAGKCDNDAVTVLVDEGPFDIRRLVEMNVPFDLNEDGDLSITREGGHRRNRIVHAGGDATGRETVKTLAAIAKNRPNITFFPQISFVDALLDYNGVCGAVVNDKEYYLIATRNIVICTGGIGQLYTHSTNPAVATGDGIAAAKRAGARLDNMEFVQFHPTGLYSTSEESRSFLISEAVRGEGGLLKNLEGERFMVGRHELAELAPRDIVAREITRELKRTGACHAWVDITEKSESFLSARFPTIYNECLSRGINISRDYIPVCPVQHYLMGGITTDLNGLTNIEGLYACGEAANTGVHGANRLASNSMLECLVFGRRAADHINKGFPLRGRLTSVSLPEVPSIPYAQADRKAEIRNEIKLIMDKYGHVIRSAQGLEAASARLEEILDIIEHEYYEGREYLEILNMAIVAREIISAALKRKESVGAHYIEA